MSNVLVDKQKIDILANAIANKSGEAVTMTLDEMVEAVDGIDTSGGGEITPSGTISITQNGQVDVTNYATADVNVSGGGGASNCVVGSFTPTTTGVVTVPIPYTGTGYPLSMIVFVKDGYAASDNTDFYNLVSLNAICIWGFTKTYPNIAPDYTNNNSGCQVDPFYVKKNSTSSAFSYSENSDRGTRFFCSLNPYAAWSNLIKMPSATSMEVYVADSGCAFRPNFEYAYHIVYSS